MEYIETKSGSRVSRRSELFDAPNIRLLGKCVMEADTIFRGDLAPIFAGRYCLIGERTVVRPSTKLNKDKITYITTRLGDYVMIGADCIIEAAAIGSQVKIGDNCIIGERSVIYDCCELRDGTILPPDSVVLPFSIVAGVPGVVVGELGGGADGDIAAEVLEAHYELAQAAARRAK